MIETTPRARKQIEVLHEIIIKSSVMIVKRAKADKKGPGRPKQEEK